MAEPIQVTIWASLQNPADPHVLLETNTTWGHIRELAPDALAGAKYDASQKVYRVLHCDWALVHASLLTSGIALDVEPEIASWLADELVLTRDLEAKAQARMLVFDQELAKRGHVLREYQKTGILWLASRRGGLLCDDPGLGKTLTTLCAVPEGHGCVIVCPVSLKEYWAQECATWRPDLKPVILSGRGSFRWPKPTRDLYHTHECIILGDASLPDTFVDWNGVYLAVDEAHAYKNRESARTKRMMALAARIRKNRGWSVGLTGTPIMNEPTELYTLCEVFGIDRLAWDNWPAYVRLFGGVTDPYGRMHWNLPAGSQQAEQARARLARVSLRRRQADVLPELPELSYREIPIALPRNLYKELDELAKSSLTGEVLDAWEWHDVMPDFENWSEVKAELAALKYEATCALVKEYELSEKKILVFSDHRFVIDLLAKRPDWATITGDTKASKRQDIVDSFQAGKHPGLAMTIKAGGVGFNLTNASHVLMLDLAVTPSLNSQAIKRAWRSGQKKPVLVTQLVSMHPLEKRIHKILMTKQRLIEQL